MSDAVVCRERLFKSAHFGAQNILRPSQNPADSFLNFFLDLGVLRFEF